MSTSTSERQIVKTYLLNSKLFTRPRRLAIDAGYFEFEVSDLKGSEFRRVDCADVIDFWHGITAIQWYEFFVGREYRLVLKIKGQNDLKIVFRDYFKSNRQRDAYREIVSLCWEHFQRRNVSAYLERIDLGETVLLQGVYVSQTGVRLRAGQFILWRNLAVVDYHTYFVLCQQDSRVMHDRITVSEFESEALWCVVKAMQPCMELSR